MDPMQQPGQQPPAGQYDFITNSPQKTKKPLIDPGSTKGRIMVVVGIVVLLMIGATIVTTIMSAGSKAARQNLKTVYATQQELIRVADLGVKDALSSDTRGFASTVSMSVKSDQIKTASLLASNGAKIKPEEANAKKSTKTDEALAAAQAANRYDETLVENLNKQITAYQQALDAAHTAISSKKDQEALVVMYTGAQTLAKAPETNQ